MPGTRNRGKDEEDEGENRVDVDIKCIWISWRGSSNGCIATIWKQSSSCQKGNNIQLSFPNAQRQNNSPKCATHTHTHTLACTCKSYKASRCGWRQKTNIMTIYQILFLCRLEFFFWKVKRCSVGLRSGNLEVKSTPQTRCSAPKTIPEHFCSVSGSLYCWKRPQPWGNTICMKGCTSPTTTLGARW